MRHSRHAGTRGGEPDYESAMPGADGRTLRKPKRGAAGLAADPEYELSSAGVTDPTYDMALGRKPSATYMHASAFGDSSGASRRSSEAEYDTADASADRTIRRPKKASMSSEVEYAIGSGDAYDDEAEYELASAHAVEVRTLRRPAKKVKGAGPKRGEPDYVMAGDFGGAFDSCMQAAFIVTLGRRDRGRLRCDVCAGRCHRQRAHVSTGAGTWGERASPAPHIGQSLRHCQPPRQRAAVYRA